MTDDTTPSCRREDRTPEQRRRARRLALFGLARGTVAVTLGPQGEFVVVLDAPMPEGVAVVHARESDLLLVAQRIRRNDISANPDRRIHAIDAKVSPDAADAFLARRFVERDERRTR